MNQRNDFLGTSKLVLAAAVFSTLLTGCNRQASTDHAVASPGASTSSTADASKSTAGSMGGTSGTGTSTSNAGAVSTTAANNASDAVAAANNAASRGASAADATTSGGAASGSGAAGGAMALSDAQIEGILTTANTAEIDAGKMAQSKSQNAKVKEYAGSMVKEHTAVNEQVAALAKKTSTSPAESDVTKTLKDDAAKASATLKAANGTAFDKAYIDSQIADHEKVLRTIDTMLMPNAKDAGLKQLVEKVRPAVSMHLDHAKTLQASMK